MKGEAIVELDKTDIHSVYEELFDISEQTTPVLHEKVGRADYYWKFINDEEDESIGSVTGYVFLCSKNGELHKLVVSNNFYQETIISNQASTMPTANAYNLGQIIQYTGTTTSDYTNGFFYKCTESSGTYSWETVNVQSGGGSTIQYTALPENPSVGQIIQYVGENTDSLRNGSFYKYINPLSNITWNEFVRKEEFFTPNSYGTTFNVNDGVTITYNGTEITRISGANEYWIDGESGEIAIVNSFDLVDWSIVTVSPSLYSWTNVDTFPSWRGTSSELEEALEDLPVGTRIEVTDDYEESSGGDTNVINNKVNSNWQGNGYNLIPYPYYEGSSKEASGITFTVSNDVLYQ